jgi:adenosylcobinamide-GDP ribazoletransferase
MGSSHPVHAFLAAVQFLTRLPVPGGMNRPGTDPRLLRSAVGYFPLVGGLIGLLTGGVAWAAGHVCPPLVAVLLALAAEAVLTGGLHEDAVADCADAFGGGWTREDVLRILKDSRVGSFGALALVLAVGLRAGCLASVGPELVVAAAATSGAVGRWAGVLLMAVPPVPDREGLGRDVGARVGWPIWLAATLAAIPGAAWYMVVEPYRLTIGLGLAIAVVGVWGFYVRRRLGGTTGDCLGAGCYLGQLAVLLAAAGRSP